jgi:DNA-binding Lrp family transcriptional regulator
MELKMEILEILQKDARASVADMAVMLGATAEDIRAAIAELERDRVIIQYNTVIDWNKMGNEAVQALIEVKVTPQRGKGFDAIARRIYGFQEVHSVYLMSGAYDLMVLVEGNTMRDVAFFVAEKLSTIDGVISTSTHFVLKKYKDNGIIVDDEENGDSRLAVTP